MNSNKDIVGINSQGLKMLGLDLLDYSEEFQKIKEQLDNIESRLRQCFIGEGPNQFNDSLKDFSNNLTYISKNIKNYHELCQQVIKTYEYQDMNSFRK